MRDVVETVSAKTESSKCFMLCRFCSLKSLYIGFNWTLGFICQLLKSFIFI